MPRKQLGISPVLVVVLASIGCIVNKSIRRTMEALLRSELVTRVEIEPLTTNTW